MRHGGTSTATGIPVILVHGQVVTSRYMVPLAQRLAPRHPVYAPDLPGYGRSGKPRDAPPVPELSEALVAFMDAEGIERAALVANSYGCQVVVDLAARHPRRVLRGALLGPVDARERSLLVHAARWLRNAPKEPAALTPILLRDLLDAGPRRAIQTMRHLVDDDVAGKLPRVQAPMLVVRGSEDPIVPQGWVEEVVRLLPQGRLAVVPGAPHTLNYTAARETAAILLPFLAEDARGDRA